MRRDLKSHRLINVARAQTYSNRQMQSVIVTSLRNVSNCDIFNKFNVSHHFNEFWMQSWSCLHSGFIQDTQRTHFICRIHLFENFTNLHVWTEHLIDFHRSVIWADNCHILSFISNKAFHFSAFPPSDVQLFALNNFRVENSRFREIAQNVLVGPPDLKMHESASHHFASQATRSKQPAEPKRHGRGPRDSLPTGNAELLFLHISQLLWKRKLGNQLLILAWLWES